MHLDSRMLRYLYREKLVVFAAYATLNIMTMNLRLSAVTVSNLNLSLRPTKTPVEFTHQRHAHRYHNILIYHHTKTSKQEARGNKSACLAI